MFETRLTKKVSVVCIHVHEFVLIPMFYTFVGTLCNCFHQLIFVLIISVCSIVVLICVCSIAKTKFEFSLSLGITGKDISQKACSDLAAFGGGIISNLSTDEQLNQCHLQIKFVLCVDHTRTKTVSDFEGARAICVVGRCWTRLRSATSVTQSNGQGIYYSKHFRPFA